MDKSHKTKRISLQAVRTTYTIVALSHLLIVLASKSANTNNPSGIALPGCPDSCNGVPIPYPFGIGRSCCLSEDFEVSCNATTNDTYTDPYLFGTVPILNISITLGQARISNPISYQCYNISTKEEETITYYAMLSGSSFRFNDNKNKFMVIGCDTLAFASFSTDQNSISVGCSSRCSNLQGLTNGSCSGLGCCQTVIPKGTTIIHVDFDASYNNSNVHSFSPCGYAMLMEDDGFMFDTTYITTDDLKGREMPLVIDWAIGNTACDVAQNNRSAYACISSNSVCLNSSGGPGYLCNCSHGYQGNPYLDGGCQDVDECANNNPCSKHGKCHNTDGGYRCSCHFGWRIKTYNECELNLQLVIGITIAVAVCGAGTMLVPLILAIWTILRRQEVRRNEKIKQKYFNQNQGLLQQQLMSSTEDTTGRMKIFSLEELEKATNKFDQARILGCGGHGTVYKGILSDLRVVAIKRSNIITQSEIDQFINEVVILSQINHRNVVKLLGCCLETEVPLLVYEFISNGTLSDHLHAQGELSLSWKDQIRISLETARAVSYLHSAASMSVFHRDLKCSNILLDDCLIAKLSDFGTSKSVHIDQTGVTTLIQGTYGYLDPEYYHTGRLTEKSDVYSFGVILAELLTRQKAFSPSTSSESGNLIARFIMLMTENQMIDILDSQIVEEGPKPKRTNRRSGSAC
ncbi:Wall-associated kinase family protein [Rhynchospora pubera]|uniref:Wall-associated kinase family protein n=1 Tax=Rhynchospora pubera TaxID=906938 RepID=A0AAV8GN81_9POAL|nr:Wall-associated kinase family protein [Rhynchospora pubera]